MGIILVIYNFMISYQFSLLSYIRVFGINNFKINERRISLVIWIGTMGLWQPKKVSYGL